MADDENACVRNIVKEIMRECHPRKIKFNKNFVTYLTKLLLVNPNWGIGDDFFNQRQNVQHFVNYVIEELLTKQEDPRTVTLKIQFYFSCNLEHMQFVTELTKKELKKRLAPLKDEIYICSKLESKEMIDTLYKKIVYYITLVAGLGNPAKQKVYEEALIALKSILDEEELKEFVTLSRHEKHIQINQFTSVVSGIRLFNKDCEKGGEGIANLPDLMHKAVSVIRVGTEEGLLMVMEKVNILTTVVDKCYAIRNTYKGYQMHLELVGELSKYNIDITRLKDLLIFFRQYELILRRILEELDRIHYKVELIFMEMEKMLKTIHETVHLKIAIPVGVVFPLFKQLWEIWEHFQDEALTLSRLSTIMSNLEKYEQQMNYDHKAIQQIVGDGHSMTDAERLAQTAHVQLTSEKEEVAVVKSDSIKNIDDIKLEYLGFCCWKLIETDGALIPGNPSMGIIIYKGKHYVFSCEEGFKEFNKDPQLYVHYVLDLARKKPQLINFFQMKEDMESVYHITKLVESKVEIRMCEEKFIQTVSRIEETHIDPDYRWNIWDLKREVLTMASLSHSTTTSTQTDKTGSKNSVRSQTYYTKQVEVQTSKETHTNVPKPAVFIYGLRGRKDDQQFKIDLTRPTNER